MTVEHKQRYRFSEAPIWQMQRAYYEEVGLNAWNNDKIPQYATSNPVIAGAYAEMIFGFLQDRAGKEERSASAWEPVQIVELGAGAGRFAFHVLHELSQLIDYAGIALPSFRYIMTDLAMSNVLAWREHPALQTFIARGMLDFAGFDAVQDTELNLIVSGETIRGGDLKQPLIIVANYFFDSIPQELLYVKEGRIYEADVLIEYPEGSDSLQTAELLDRLSFQYTHRHAPEYEQESYPYRDIIALYREQLEDSHILFPVAGLNCLARLNRLSQAGMLLITADKGDHLLEDWAFMEPPELTLHGSAFSLTANYHAIEQVMKRDGALALFPPHHYRNINVGCIIQVDQPMSCVQTRLAYRRVIERFGPDEFFSLKEWIDPNIAGMELQQLVSFWRLGGYDAEFFMQSTEQISSLLAEAADQELQDLSRGIEIMWSSYYEMEQRYDLALEAGLLLFEMDMYADSKRFLEISVRKDREEIVSTVYYCLAICCFEMGLEDEGLQYTRELIKLEPDNEEALALIHRFESV
ncbi:SAM-dependent methyltransferase [Paenibacillus sacheonensis]|uniref:Tetratricopeptide repeat protein n=1 Tax=Paenibacillus sacheonensis TaxID=742054 RepID=A0A7X4YQN8_9BACL|nr:SAM-dependent methyltransferase [Paenibacillus sacheonensis]MBM7567845.1 tetratricopeptide (TPR) repeat protein [Paenibacillus sacheonensis]NBC70733.1 tetratricopeptide repeat protein [Paenibacillus sacheonensis]